MYAAACRAHVNDKRVPWHRAHTIHTHNTHTIHTIHTHNTHTIHTHTQYTQYTHNTHTIHTQYTHNTHIHTHYDTRVPWHHAHVRTCILCLYRNLDVDLYRGNTPACRMATATTAQFAAYDHDRADLWSTHTHWRSTVEAPACRMATATTAQFAAYNHDRADLWA